jgi:hypothetical protein
LRLGVFSEQEEVTGTARFAIRGAEAFEHDGCAKERGDPLVLPAFLIGRGRIDDDFIDARFRQLEQMIDMPTNLFLSRQVALEPRRQATHRAAGVDVGPFGKQRDA